MEDIVYIKKKRGKIETTDNRPKELEGLDIRCPYCKSDKNLEFGALSRSSYNEDLSDCFVGCSKCGRYFILNVEDEIYVTIEEPITTTIA